MSEKTHLFFSNSQEVLGEYLASRLFYLNADPMLRRYVVVESSSQKEWLMRSFAENPKLGICAGVKFLSLKEAFSFFTKEVIAPKKLPSSMELYFALQKELRALPQSDVFLPLFDYLETPNQKKLASLCHTLSHLFLQYGIYGVKEVESWLQSQDWQEALWQKIYAHPNWLYPSKALSHLAPFAEEIGHIHFFALSHMPALYAEFFERMSESVPVCHYILSPCSEYWGDIASDREASALQKKYRKKNASEKFLSSLEEYLKDRNPLLANFGKLGRSYVRALDVYDSHLCEEYIAPDDPQNLLEEVQKDIFFSIKRDEKNTLEIAPADDSLQVHLCGSSRLREMQILQDRLIDIISKYQDTEDPLYPRDILVLAPDINAYAPYIKLVFGSLDAPFDYKIRDLDLKSGSSLIQGLFHVLELAESKFEAEKVFALWNNPSFQTRHNLSWEEVDQLKDWAVQTRVRFAYQDKENEHSWEQGKDRLLFSLISEGALPGYPFPPFEIEMADAHLASVFLELIDKLYNDLALLRTNAELLLSEWAKFIKELKETYFAIGEDDQEAASLIDDFLLALQQMDEGNKYPFGAVYELLKKELSSSSGKFQGFLCNAISFGTLQKGAALPAKVICLIGMEEEAFPRVDKELSLNKIKNLCPSRQEEDRYLFLRILMSAKKHLLISYRNLSLEDGKEVSPSLLLQVLLSYLDAGYSFEGKKISELISLSYPQLPFHKRLFAKNSPCRSHNIWQFKAAAMHYHPEPKEERLIFLPPNEPIPIPPHITLDLKTLCQLSRHPIRYFFNHKLGIYFEENEREKYKEEEFFFQGSFSFLQSILRKDADQVVNSLEKQGKLPVGLFGKAAKIDLLEKANRICRQAGIAPQSIYRAILKKGCKEKKEIEEGCFELPALQVKVGECIAEIIGEIPHYSSRGLLLNQESKMASCLKEWPLILTYLALPDAAASLIFLKKDVAFKNIHIEEPIQALADFISYYFHAYEKLSPLLPEWSAALLQKDAASLQKGMEQSLTGWGGYEDPYLKFLEDRSFDAFAIHQDWSPMLRRSFASLLRLYPGKDDAV